MGDVFTRRCGCGVILSLRESCKRCADAARARLHADGKCRDERIVRRGRDAMRFLHDMPPDEPERYSISLADRYEGIIEAAVAQLKYDKELDDMYAFAEELEAQLQQAKEANQRSVIDAALADTAKHEPPPAPHGFQLHGLRGARFGAGGSLGECVAGGLEAWTRSQSFEPPPVGAEVTWDVAKADMQARSEARYKIFSDLGVEYSYAARGALSCRNGALEAWRTSVMYEDACDKRRWVRLA